MQIAIVVLLAMTASVLLGGGRLVTSQACSSAVLVSALPSTHAIPTRFVDALVGGFVGLACLVAVPESPAARRRAGEGFFSEVADTLDSVADGLAASDAALGERALARARDTSRGQGSSGRRSSSPTRRFISHRRTGAHAATSSATSRPPAMPTAPCARCEVWPAQR